MDIKHFLQAPSAWISEFLADDNQLVICNGVNPSYNLGTLTKDLGYTQVGDTLEAGNAITGLHHFRQSPTVNIILATTNNSTDANLTLQYNNSGVWTEINVGSTYDAFENCLTEMEDFIGYCFIVGYDSSQNVFLPKGTLTGTTFSTTTNCTSMAQGKYVIRYRDRIYVANCYYSATPYPYRVYFSSVPSASVINWTPASDFIEVDYSEQITGISSNWDKLIIFTEFSAYMYDQSSNKKVWDTGCVQHRSIQNIGGYMIWANKDNVWTSTGGRPIAIGNDILPLIRAATPSNWRSAVVDNEYILYLGTTSARGITFTNCMCVYNFETGMWRWREFLSDTPTALARYTTSSDDFLYMGMTDGEVMVKAKYTDTFALANYQDDGNPIKAHFRTKAYDFGDPTIEKLVNQIMVYSNFGNNISWRVRVVDKNLNELMPFTTIGSINKMVSVFNNLRIKGNFIQFEGIEYSKNQAFEFYGFSTLPKINKINLLQR